jgi:hypothetical protein
MSVTYNLLDKFPVASSDKAALGMNLFPVEITFSSIFISNLNINFNKQLWILWIHFEYIQLVRKDCDFEGYKRSGGNASMSYGRSETVPGNLLRFHTIFAVLDDPRPARHLRTCFTNGRQKRVKLKKFFLINVNWCEISSEKFPN